MVVLLTGASGGIGNIINSALKEANIEVIEPSSKELNLDNEFDVSNFPILDGFIHCAGINKLADHKSIRVDELYHLFNINTVSFVKLCGELKFNSGSNIIAIGSLYATETKESRIQYSMSKHALYGAVKTIAIEKAADKIKINMVSPGFVDTALTRKNNSIERIDYLNKSIPLGLTSPCDIANLCVYLIMFNNAITGQNIVVDGGYSLKGI